MNKLLARKIVAQVEHHIDGQRIRVKIDPRELCSNRLKGLGAAILAEFDAVKSQRVESNWLTGQSVSYDGNNMTVRVTPLTGGILIEHSQSDFESRLRIFLNRKGFELRFNRANKANTEGETTTVVGTVASLAFTKGFELLLPCELRLVMMGVQLGVNVWQLATRRSLASVAVLGLDVVVDQIFELC